VSAPARCSNCGGATRNVAPSEPLELANRLALRLDEAASVLGIGEKTLRRLLPRLRCVVRDGGVVLILPDLLREDLRRLAAEAVAKPHLERIVDAESTAHQVEAENFVHQLRTKAKARRPRSSPARRSVT